jgi:hypothetical protein
MSLELSAARDLAIIVGIAVVIVLLLILLRELVIGRTRARGLGVTRDHVQRFFEQPLFGFTVESLESVDGQTVVALKAPTEAVGDLRLFGPKRELTRALITVGLSRTNNSVTAKSAIYLNGFVMIVARDWPDGSEWVRDNLRRALSSGHVATTLANPPRAVSLKVLSDVGSVILSIEATVPKPRASIVLGIPDAEAPRPERRRSSLFSQRAVRSTPLAS